MDLCSAIINSPIGMLQIVGSDKGIRQVLYQDASIANDTIPECLRECVNQLHEYFEGTRKQFNLRLDPEGTDFQLKVWDQLLTIPYSKTISYAELAILTGNKLNTRAVGNANGKNKLNIIIPCHRVIGASGKLIGYGGGLHRKEWLLRHEKSNQLEGLFEKPIF